MIKWFSSLQDKQSLTFLVFGIVDFYPSISEALLNQSLDFASQFINITHQDRNVIMHARKSLLFDQEKPWRKKNSQCMFDVTMGSYDGAEVCELVGLFILHMLKTKFNNENIGLYRDDGLAAFRNMGPRIADNTRKKFHQIFDEVGLKITVQANLKIVNFLDITLNLTTKKFCPYGKPDNPPLYINSQSNHPPAILKHLPSGIGKRISSSSCDKTEFDKASPAYRDALKASGLNQPIEYTSNSPQCSRDQQRRKRSRKIIWFNPPFSQSVSTNVGQVFLILLDRHFPKSHKLHKIFNRGSVKISYSCMENVASVIRRHNNKILKPTPPTPDKNCNCRKSDTCPLAGACLTDNLIYKAEVEADNIDPKVYIGLTEHSFKSRYNGHTSTFRHRKLANSTTLSKYIWDLKDSGTNYRINWSVLKRARAYSAGTKTCNLCLCEKLCILSADKRNLLNKRSELINKCRHLNKSQACNFKSA